MIARYDDCSEDVKLAWTQVIDAGGKEDGEREVN
jgi:hypothetical protein